MSGYLPPRTTEGPMSEVYTPDYKLDTQPRVPAPGAHDEPRDFPTALPPDVIPTAHTRITIGPRDAPLLRLAPLGFGCWAWGDVLTYGWGPSGGYDKKLNDDSVHEAWDEIVRAFPNAAVILDTAEHYGYTDGYCEKIIGRCWSDTPHSYNSGPASASNLTSEKGPKPEQQVREEGGEGSGKDNSLVKMVDRDQIVLTTKFFPVPWRHPWMYPDVVLNSLAGSLERTKLGRIDIYQLHGPSHWGFWPTLATLCDALARAYHTGRVGGIGVCNLNWEQIKYVYSELQKRKVPLVSNQVEFSLLRQDPWRTKLIENCRKLGIITIAYSPLGVGRLTGKYSSRNPPRGNRNFADISWSKIEPVLVELERIGPQEGKTPAAVALNWIMCKGAIPIPSTKNAKQVRDCLQSLGWRLTKEDEERLDVLGVENADTKSSYVGFDWKLVRHFQNWWWQQG